MTYQTPCSSPDNDPNDWFIQKDGRQYSDEPLISPIQLLTVVEDSGFDVGDEQAVAEIGARLEAKAVKIQLTARRHAKDACFTECYFRNKCLAKALEDGEVHGTWGGYHEEELREIRREIARQKTDA